MILWDWLRKRLAPAPAPVPVPRPPDPPPPGPPFNSGRLLDLHNRERARFGLPPLNPLPVLARCAAGHAAWMAAARHLDHVQTRPTGRVDLGGRLREVGFDFQAAGENIAAGYATADAVMAGWLASSGHRANIRRDLFHYVGFSCVPAADGTNYWCVVFGTPVRAAAGRFVSLSGPDVEAGVSSVLVTAPTSTIEISHAGHTENGQSLPVRRPGILRLRRGD